MSEPMFVCLSDECAILTCAPCATSGRCACGAELVECLRPTQQEIIDVINLALRQDRGISNAAAAAQVEIYVREGLDLKETLDVALDILARHIKLAYGLQQRIRAIAAQEMH